MRTVSDLWKNIKRSKLCIIGISEKHRVETYFNLIKGISLKF